MYKITLILFLISINLKAQVLSGIVKDKNNNPIPYVNIFLPEYKIGTITNKDGMFKLKLPKGKFTIQIQHISYQPIIEELNIQEDTIIYKNFILQEKIILLEPVVVSEQDQYALEIINKVKNYKKELKMAMPSFKYLAYNKTIAYIKTKKKNIIGGILENFSNCYFEWPDNYKEIIIAKRQTSNFSEASNVLTLGGYIDVFSELITIDEMKIVSPLAENAQNYYNYQLNDSIKQNNEYIYIITFDPKKDNLYLFTGKLYISSKDYNLVKAELYGNKSLKTSIKDDIQIIETYRKIDNKIFMPFSIIISYDIKIPLVKKISNGRLVMVQICLINNIKKLEDKKIFDNFSLTENLLSKKKQKALWDNSQFVLLTKEEKNAYIKIDTEIKKAPFVDKTIIYLNKILPYTSKIPVSSFADFYHYSKVEGHYVGIGLDTKKLFDKFTIYYKIGKARLQTKPSYKFSFAFKTPIPKISLGFSKFNDLYFREQNINYSQNSITYKCLLNKNDYANYYKSKGNSYFMRFKNNFINIKLSYYKKNDYNITRIIKGFKENALISSGTNNFINISFKYDSRKYITIWFMEVEDITRDYTILDAQLYISNKTYLKSTWNYKKYYFEFAKFNKFPSFGSIYFDFVIGNNYNDIIEQNKFYLPPTYSLRDQNTFYGINDNTYSGDNIIMFSFEYDFKNLLFNMLKIPFFKYNKYGLSVFYKQGYLNKLSDKIRYTKASEIGFSINNILLFFRLNFSWTKINNLKSKFKVNLILNRNF